jgi:predicted RND superfamily exporter protein
MRLGLEEFLLTRRLPVAILVALLTVLAARAYSGFTVENGLDAWFDAGDADYQRYTHMRDVFEVQESLFVVLQAADVFQPDVLRRIDRLTRAVEARPEIRRVTSLTSIEDITGTPDGVRVAPLVDMDALTEVDVAALRARVLADPFFPGVIVSRDGRLTIVASEMRKSTAETNVAVVEALHAAMADVAAPGITMHLAGWPAVNVLMDRLTQEDVARGLPVMLALYFVGLAFAFRSIRAVLIVVVGVVLVVFWTMGAFAGTGLEGTFLTVSALPAILLTLTLATGVHVIARFQEAHAEIPDVRAAVARALQAVAVPVLVSSATTAIGFGSLVVSPLPPVRHLAMFAALGMVLVCAVSLSVLPLGLVSAPPRSGGHTAAFLDRPLAWIATLAIGRPRAILGGSLVLAAVALAGLPHLRPQGNGLAYLPPDAEAVVAMRSLEADFGGASDVEVVVTGPAKSLLDPAATHLVGAVQEVVASFPETGATLSYTDLLRRMHRALHDGDPAAYRLPETRDAIAQELFLYETSGGDELGTWVDPAGYATARVSAYATSFQEIEETRAFYESLDRRLAALARPATPALHLTVTGDGPLWYRVNSSLLTTMAKSFALTVVGVTLMMVLALRSVRLGLLAMVPNLLPVLVAVGTMGWAGVRLDFATVMVAGIALGIAVDDTVHYLHRYRLELAATGDPRTAVERALASVGRAMITTSVVLFAGFSLMALSAFPPHRTFGLVLAGTMVVALLCDLLLLPALLLAGPGRRTAGAVSPASS